MKKCEILSGNHGGMYKRKVERNHFLLLRRSENTGHWFPSLGSSWSERLDSIYRRAESNARDSSHLWGIHQNGGSRNNDTSQQLRGKKKKKNWHVKMKRRRFCSFHDTQSGVRRVEIWGQDTVTMENQRQGHVPIWTASKGFQTTVCQLFSVLGHLEAHFSLLLKYLIQLFTVAPAASIDPATHRDVLERLNNYLNQLSALFTSASH